MRDDKILRKMELGLLKVGCSFTWNNIMQHFFASYATYNLRANFEVSGWKLEFYAGSHARSQLEFFPKIMKLNCFRHFWALKNDWGTLLRNAKNVSKYSNLYFVIRSGVIHPSVKLKTGPKYSIDGRSGNQSIMSFYGKHTKEALVVEKIRYQYFQWIEFPSRDSESLDIHC